MENFWQTVGLEPAYQCRKHKRCGFSPWVRKIPWRGEYGNPLQCSCLGKPHGQRILVGYSQWDHRVQHDWSNFASMHSIYFFLEWNYTKFTGLKWETEDSKKLILFWVLISQVFWKNALGFRLFLAESKDLRWIHLWFFCEVLSKLCCNNNYLLKIPTPQALVPAHSSHRPKWRLNACCWRENSRLQRVSLL